MFKKTQLCTAVLAAFAGSVCAQEAQTTPSQTPAAQTQRVEITGSRIKRADVEGALPVTVVTRDALEASGANTVAEFVRNLTFSSTGAFRPQSGTSWQSFSGVDLRGMGYARTLVLLDGRRVVKAPNQGSAADLNSIPMAAIERVEILTDGASAIYGSDAIGGVINFITRKDLDGGVVTVGMTKPEGDGGKRQEYSALWGVVGDKGRATIGVAKTNRDIVYTNSRPWGAPESVGSTFSNNFLNPAESVPATETTAAFPASWYAVPGGCNDRDQGFFLVPGGGSAATPGGAKRDLCLYDYNKVAAEEASMTTTSFFMFGETKLTDDWSAYLQGSVARVESFGRYAPTPSSPFLGAGYIVVDKDSPNNPTNGANDVLLRHRFAAAGNRDTNVDSNVYDVTVGAQGHVAGVDLDFGLRSSISKYNEVGGGYIVAALAKQFIDSGEYDIYNPFNNSEEILKGMTATTSRSSLFRQNSAYLSGSMPVFKMAGGDAMLALGGEVRNEVYKDIYDSLSEAGQIVGSAGNSAGGSRKVGAAYGELVLPVIKDLEIDLAARFEKYSDFGNDFAPKASISYKPINELKLRASVGKGFRAPALDILTAKTSFSAESVVDPRTAVVNGLPPTTSVQVDTWVSSNPALKSEKSTQFAFGAVWDVMPELSVKVDYWSIKLKDAITYISAQDIVNADNGTSSLPIPPGLGLVRYGNGAIQAVYAGYANQGEVKTSGIDVNLSGAFNFGEYGKLNTNYSWSYVGDYKVNGVQQAGSYGRPKNRLSLNHLWSLGDFDAGWNINMIGDSQDVDGEDIYRTGTYTTHDFQFGYTAPWKGKFVFGLVNAFGKLPVVDFYTSRSYNMDLYDYYGRQVYVRYMQNF